MIASFNLTQPQIDQYGETLAPPYVGALAFSTVIILITFPLRIYAQWQIRNLHAWDNRLAIAAFVCFFMFFWGVNQCSRS
jgi:hypothetical protein